MPAVFATLWILWPPRFVDQSGADGGPQAGNFKLIDPPDRVQPNVPNVRPDDSREAIDRGMKADAFERNRQGLSPLQRPEE